MKRRQALAWAAGLPIFVAGAFLVVVLMTRFAEPYLWYWAYIWITFLALAPFAWLAGKVIDRIDPPPETPREPWEPL
jgi:hypothetical protein